MRSPNIDDALRQVKDGLRQGPVQVVGGLGSGRHTLAEGLRNDLNAIVVDLLSPHETDASAALWLEAGVAIGFREKPARSSHDDMETHGRRLATALSEKNRVLVLLLPARQPSDEHTAVLRARALALLAGLRQHRNRVEIVHEAGGAAPWAARVLLPQHAAAIDVDAFGSYARHADALARACNGDAVAPLIARLAVGAIAWGMPAVEAAELCRAPAMTGRRALLDHLAARIEPEIRLALRRLGLVRRDFARADAIALTGVPAEHAPLVTDVLAYGNERVRVAAPVHAWLLRDLPVEAHDDESEHARLAAHYRRADGVLDPFEIDAAPQMVAWIEKSHHLAHGGTGSAAEWRRQKHVDPWFYWARARALSLGKHFEAAAAAYREGLEVFANDDYGWHYLGFNLDRANGDDGEVEEAYRKAVALAPTMPRWNSRLACWLIQHGKLSAARAAWATALRRIDPDGTDTGRVIECCGFVAAAWFAQGRAGDARVALAPVRDGEGLLAKHIALKEQLVRDEQRFKHLFASLEKQTTKVKADGLRALWVAFRKRAGSRLPDPVVTLLKAEDNDSLELSLPDWLLSVDVKADGRFDWFARRRGTEQVGGAEDLASIEAVMDGVGQWLDRICDNTDDVVAARR